MPKPSEAASEPQAESTPAPAPTPPGESAGAAQAGGMTDAEVAAHLDDVLSDAPPAIRKELRQMALASVALERAYFRSLADVHTCGGRLVAAAQTLVAAMVATHHPVE